MSVIINWLRLLRPFNLLLIAISPTLLWFTLVKPQFASTVLTIGQTLQLGLAIALVAAGGNIVNDISDQTIDELNGRPNPLINDLPIAVGWITYIAVTAMAAIVSYRLAVELDYLQYLWLLPITVLLLFAYAFSLKCKPLIGNVLIAAFCAAVPGLLLLAEPVLTENLGSSILSQSLAAYIVFAFFGTWAREIVKDLEDRNGDAKVGCRTLANSQPEAQTVKLIRIILAFALMAVTFLTVVWFLEQNPMRSIGWFILGVVLSIIYVQLKDTNTREEYANFSKNLKYVIALGLILLFSFTFMVA